MTEIKEGLLIASISLEIKRKRWEKITSGLFIQIKNANLNILQDNEKINRVVLHPPSLVLANRITIIFNNEIQAHW